MDEACGSSGSRGADDLDGPLPDIRRRYPGRKRQPIGFSVAPIRRDERGGPIVHRVDSGERSGELGQENIHVFRAPGRVARESGDQERGHVADNGLGIGSHEPGSGNG